MKKSIILISALMLLATACVKEKSFNEIYRIPGTPIVFGAATGFDNSVDTRTIYSNQTMTVSGTGYERIDWVANDPVTIWYGSDNGNYKISGAPTASNQNSNASVTFQNGTQLTWSSGANHMFYAMYPAASMNANAGLTAAGRVSGNIPGTQTVTYNSSQDKYLPDMKNAYLVSRKTITSSDTESTVRLPFTPAYTAFEFVLKVASTAASITRFELVSNGNLVGNFAFNITGENSNGATWTPSSTTVTSPGNTITVNVNKQLNSSSDVLNLTVLALPVSISGLTVKLTLSNGKVLSLPLKDDATTFHTFLPCKKYVISNTNIPGQWVYTVEDIEDISLYGHLQSLNNAFTVKSYRTDLNGNKESVKWKVQYSQDGSSWSDSQPTAWQTGGAKFSVSNVSGSGSTTTAGESNAANILRDHASGEKETSGFDSEQAAIAVLQGRASLPSSTSDAGDGYFDLSKHPIYPVSAIDGTEITQETANCYVITRPGKYKFPLVYGNAIRNSVTNTKAFAPGGLSSTNNTNYYMNRFLNHNDQAITDPWLKNNGATPTDAVVVWQDVANASMQILLDSDISISGDYIRFEIKSEHIRPGNIVLAARQNGTIVWSWHIWVTEKELGPHTVIDKMGQTNDMMEYNLGWTDKTNGYGQHWNDWSFYIRIIQTDASGNILNSTNPQNVDAVGAADVFSVTQYGESITVNPNVGSNPFYQWGRKDPILPAASSDASKNYYSAQGYTVTDPSDTRRILNEAISGNTLSVSVAIKNPNHLVHHTGSHHWIGGGTANGLIGNLWDADMITTRSGGLNAQTMVNRLPIKTVYDPCPRGYVVPWAYAFSNFWDKAATYNSGYGNPVPSNGLVTNEGYKFNDGNGGTIFIPFAGARGGDGNNPSEYIYDVTKSMYYWSAGSLPCDDTASDAYLKAKHFCYWNQSDMGIRAFYDQYKEGAYPIRPVLESVQRVNTGATTGGMEGNTYDFNDGWTIN